MPSREAVELAYRDALLGLVHELYFKKSHYPGSVGRFTKEDRERAKERYQRSGWLSGVDDTDPITCLLAEVAACRSSGSKHSRKAVDLEVWERAESSINARLRAIFGLLGPAVSSSVVQAFVPVRDPSPPLVPVLARSLVSGKRLDRTYGQPDLLLRGDDALILMEMKVRGGKARAKYDADQFLKYLRLAIDARSQSGEDLRTVHLVAAPSNSGRVFTNPSKWLTRVPSHGECLCVDPRGFRKRLSPRRRKQVKRKGSLAWILESLNQMPTIFVDFETLLSAVAGASSGSPHTRELRRQVRRARSFGSRPAA